MIDEGFHNLKQDFRKILSKGVDKKDLRPGTRTMKKRAAMTTRPKV